jgi:hypothetical protein
MILIWRRIKPKNNDLFGPRSVYLRVISKDKTYGIGGDNEKNEGSTFCTATRAPARATATTRATTTCATRWKSS